LLISVAACALSVFGDSSGIRLIARATMGRI
jgi:hypothetical protein